MESKEHTAVWTPQGSVPTDGALSSQGTSWSPGTSMTPPLAFSPSNCPKCHQMPLTLTALPHSSGWILLFLGVWSCGLPKGHPLSTDSRTTFLTPRRAGHAPSPAGTVEGSPPCTKAAPGSARRVIATTLTLFPAFLGRTRMPTSLPLRPLL